MNTERNWWPTRVRGAGQCWLIWLIAWVELSQALLSLVTLGRYTADWRANVLFSDYVSERSR